LTKKERAIANSIITPDMIDVSFADIGGLESIKEEIEQMIGII
jgi:SpoVK/Ycf46/Vps4 family AAA+-type ATPase